MSAAPKQLMLTGQQMSALVLAESIITCMGINAQVFEQLGAKSFVDTLRKATESLKATHEAFLSDTQRSVSIAAPADVARLVAAP